MMMRMLHHRGLGLACEGAMLVEHGADESGEIVMVGSRDVLRVLKRGRWRRGRRVHLRLVIGLVLVRFWQA